MCHFSLSYHVSLCFRPLYLPLRVLFTAESFTLSSNIIVDTATLHLRYSYPKSEVCNILISCLYTLSQPQKMLLLVFEHHTYDVLLFTYQIHPG